MRHAQPEHIAAQLADHQPHVRQGLGVGTHGGPGGARLRGQVGDGRLGRRGNCGEARRDCPCPVRHAGTDRHALGADAAIVVFDGQRDDVCRIEAVRHGQAGAGQHRAVAEVPGPAVRVQHARVGEAALEGEQTGPAAQRRRDADGHRRRDVVDVEANRGVVVGRPGEGRGAELEMHLGVVEVGGDTRPVVTVGVRKGLVATRRDRHVQRLGAVAPVDVDGVAANRRCGGAVDHQRNGGAFRVHRGWRHREPLADDFRDHKHRCAASARQSVVVGDGVGGGIKAGLGGQEVEDLAAGQGRHHAAGRGDVPFQCPGIEHAHIGERADQCDRVELGHHLAGAGIDHRRHVVDDECGRHVGRAQVVVLHGDRDVQRVRRRGAQVVIVELALEGAAGSAGGHREGLGDAVAPVDRDLEAVLDAGVVDLQQELRQIAFVDRQRHRRDGDRRRDVVDMQRGGGQAAGQAGVVVAQFDGEDDVVAVGGGRVVIVEPDRNGERAVADRERGGAHGAAAGPGDPDRVRVVAPLVGEAAAQHRGAAFVDGGGVEGQPGDLRHPVDQCHGAAGLALPAVVVLDDDAEGAGVLRRAGRRGVVFDALGDGEAARHAAGRLHHASGQARGAIAPVDLDDVGVAGIGRVGEGAGDREGFAFVNPRRTQRHRADDGRQVEDGQRCRGRAGADHVGGRD